MPTNDCKYCDKLEFAFAKSTTFFDKSTVMVLRYHLEDRYGIRFEAPCSTLEEIENALRDITGPASELIINRMREFLPQ